jgi:hypothetical protein
MKCLCTLSHACRAYTHAPPPHPPGVLQFFCMLSRFAVIHQRKMMQMQQSEGQVGAMHPTP